MARVIVGQSAADALESLIATRGLPADARDRVRRTLAPLAAFPLIGPAIGRGGLRFLIGPWRWLLVIYEYDEAADEVHVVGFEDGRTQASARRRAPR